MRPRRRPQIEFPFSMRPLMAGWNALFHDPTPYQPVPAQSAEWNRGAYLVNGLGHCGACHTPRNALGAEQGGKAFLSGAMATAGRRPRSPHWRRSRLCRGTRRSLYRYLRHGHSPRHGIAGGPMAEVVRELSAGADEDIRAMATYLASFNPGRRGAADEAMAQQHGRQCALRNRHPARRSACSTVPARPATTTATARRCWA
jgi:nicotinate dehydrogenase subunit B